MNGHKSTVAVRDYIESATISTIRRLIYYYPDLFFFITLQEPVEEEPVGGERASSRIRFETKADVSLLLTFRTYSVPPSFSRNEVSPDFLPLSCLSDPL
jgi:hypothetical protein